MLTGETIFLRLHNEVYKIKFNLSCGLKDPLLNKYYYIKVGLFIILT